MNPRPREERMQALKECTFTKVDKGLADGSIPEPCRKVIEDFRDRFPDKLPKILPPDRGSRNHRIDLIPEKLHLFPNKGYYRVVRKDKWEDMNVKLQELKDAHHISPMLTTPAAISPALMVGKNRLVGDFRGLNDCTKEHAQNVPPAQDVIDMMAEAKYFTVLDMTSGYFQLLIDPKSR